MSRKLVWIELKRFRGFGCSECGSRFKPSGAAEGKSFDEMRNFELQRDKELNPMFAPITLPTRIQNSLRNQIYRQLRAELPRCRRFVSKLFPLVAPALSLDVSAVDSSKTVSGLLNKTEPERIERERPERPRTAPCAPLPPASTGNTG
jgi:hypothetical protein